MIVLEMKCPQLSKPEATAARNEIKQSGFFPGIQAACVRWKKAVANITWDESVDGEQPAFWASFKHFWKSSLILSLNWEVTLTRTLDFSQT